MEYLAMLARLEFFIEMNEKNNVNIENIHQDNIEAQLFQL